MSAPSVMAFVFSLLLLILIPLTSHAQTEITIQQLTDTTDTINQFPSNNVDGSLIAFESNGDISEEMPGPTNPDKGFEIFLIDEAGKIIQQTDSIIGGGSSTSPSISSEALNIAYQSDADHTGGFNLDSTTEIFTVFTMNATSMLLQVTNSTTGNSTNPSINSNATRIAFESTSDLTGDNADMNREIFLWKAPPNITQITKTTSGESRNPSINAEGSIVAFESTSDITGNNPDQNSEIFFRIDGQGITQVTDSKVGSSVHPSINSDGSIIAFESTSDLTGDNADGNNEIFLWDSTSGLKQITDTFIHHNSRASIDGDGRRIAFMSNSNITGDNPDSNTEIFIWDRPTGITQVTDTFSAISRNPSISTDGRTIAFESNANPVNNNFDLNSEIFLATIIRLTNPSTGGGCSLISNQPHSLPQSTANLALLLMPLLIIAVRITRKCCSP